ncbi:MULTISPECIES: hypothetical protein [unclassified Enterobacter]|uniref:hypothetical protein n=1 Tax=unclassified Enterobacter TaxID=2608935 RepID=UPI0015C78423|nr:MULTISPECIES: hypothetical protein [unclassified Enterobacter]MBB3307083.1 hypothetical protein [Enterobacter sp. Sphag1F]NYI15593.1 hypothetical protein [Enterobacter sp. Sphag71]
MTHPLCGSHPRACLTCRRSSNDPPGETTVDSFYSFSVKQSLCQLTELSKINKLSHLAHHACTTAVQKWAPCIINDQRMTQNLNTFQIKLNIFIVLHEWHALC